MTERSRRNVARVATAARAAAPFVYATVAALASAWLLLQAVPHIVAAQSGPPWDATDHYAAREFLRHQDPFGPNNNIARPPTSALWFLPLASIPYEQIKPYVTAFMLLLLLLQIAVVALELALPVALATATLIYCAALDTWWLAYHLSVAQTSILIAFTYTLAWAALRRERDVAGGVMLGLAATMKPFAGLMAVFLVARRRWRALAAMAVAWLVIAAYMTHGFGWHSWIGFLQSKRAFTDQWLGNADNESLQTVVLHLFGASQPTAAATAIATAVSAALVAGAWLLTRAWASDVRGADLAYAVFALLSVFCNPVVWSHYNVFLLLPLLAIGAALWEMRRRLRPWWSVPAALLWVALVTLVFVDTRTSLVHTQWIRWPLTAGLAAALLVARRRRSDA